MSRIAVVGGTGYAGSHIVAEAVSRGHEVIAVSRHAPEMLLRVPGTSPLMFATYRVS